MDVIQNCRLNPYVIKNRSWTGGPDHSCVPFHARITRKSRIAEIPLIGHVDNHSCIYIDKFLMYGGPLKLHYGHLIVDSIIRLYAYNRSTYDGIAFCCCNDDFGDEDSYPNWLLAVLAYFNILRHDIYLIREPTVVSRLCFPEPGEMPYCSPHPWYLNYLKLISAPAPKEQPINLFLGRHHLLSSSKACLLGEPLISQILEEEGYIYYKPEDHTIFDNILTLARASRIIFTEGSSIYILHLLHQVKARIFMIPRRNKSIHLFSNGLSARARQFQSINPDLARQLTILKTPLGNLNSRSCSFYESLQPLLESLVQEDFISRRSARQLSPTYYSDQLLADAAIVNDKHPGYADYVKSIIDRQ
jgi:hypothetical protein